MGVVYEAEQVSLGRRVALKVLPLAATLGGTQLQRFHNEARAAAGLHHTNIVPVHFVGSERGIHFYAMQFIDGESLAAVLARLRQPPDPAPPAGGEAKGAASTQPAALLSTAGGARGREYFRAVAELGVQAAEALDYGHRVGVVHRDVKPGNLLLDGTGRLWVTDFGLAHVQGGGSLTATGELVGTLRYMSPEQALGKRVVIDHRTDIYSLGATLYELLTLRPALGGRDRQELLQQIAFEELVPPRRLHKAVPAELETVVCKALEKAPQDRYATAQELADDLRRWLDDRPIQARRPSVLQQVRKWARRHRAAVSAAAACVLLVLVAVAASAGWVLRDREARRADAARRAGEALGNAEGFAQQENWPQGLGAVEQAEGFLAGFGEETALRLQARQLRRDLEMGGKLQEAALTGTAVKDQHFDSEAIDAAYAVAFRNYGLDVEGLDPQAAAEQVRARPISRQLIAALDDWAHVRKALQREGWRQRLAVARAADPDAARNRLRDAMEGNDPKALEEAAAAGQAQEWPARTVCMLAQFARGKPSAERAAVLLAQARQRHPDDFWINHALGEHCCQSHPPRLEEAIRFYNVAVALRPQSPGARLNLGGALAEKGRLDEAIAEFREALRLQQDYTDAHYNLGLALESKGRVDEAIAEYRQAIRIKNDAPEHLNLGCALDAQGRLDGAIAEYREALRLWKDFPEAHNNLGDALRRKGRLDEALAECQEAVRLNKDFPEAHNSLGLVLKEKGRLEDAIAEHKEAIRLKEDYPEAHNSLGTALATKGRLEEAMAEWREAIRINKDCPDAHYNLGMALAMKGRLEEAITEYREATRIKQDYPEAHCNLGDALMRKGVFRQAAEEFRRGHELGSRNPRWPYPSAQWVRNAERLADLDARLPALLQGQEQPKDAGERLALAQLCQRHKKLYAAAARWYGEAFAAQQDLADRLGAAGSRYDAACAAALAGCGQGQDVDRLSDKERAGMRKQALDWLRGDLEAYRRLLEKGPAQNRPAVVRKLAHWLEDTDFADVRGEPALAKLPEAERSNWEKLWQEVEALRQRAARPPDKASPTRP